MESKKAALETDAAKAILLKGNKRFISETQLADIKAITGGKGRVEDGSVASDKPLAQILREQREAKEAKFQDDWRQMKTGKNRPLDEDELEFLDGLAAVENERRRQEQAAEADEIAAFRRALKQQEEDKAAALAEEEAREEGAVRQAVVVGPAAAPHGPLPNDKTGSGGGGDEQRKAMMMSSAVKVGIVKKMKPPIVQITKPKRPPSSLENDEDDDKDIETKRQKIDEKEKESDLAGLLGDYGSDDSD